MTDVEPKPEGKGKARGRPPTTGATKKTKKSARSKKDDDESDELSSEYGFEGFLSDEEASTKAATKGTKQGKPNSRKVLKTNDAEDVKEEEAKS